jgi:hypothetical protein
VMVPYLVGNFPLTSVQNGMEFKQIGELANKYQFLNQNSYEHVIGW